MTGVIAQELVDMRNRMLWADRAALRLLLIPTMLVPALGCAMGSLAPWFSFALAFSGVFITGVFWSRNTIGVRTFFTAPLEDTPATVVKVRPTKHDVVGPSHEVVVELAAEDGGKRGRIAVWGEPPCQPRDRIHIWVASEQKRFLVRGWDAETDMGTLSR